MSRLAGHGKRIGHFGLAFSFVVVNGLSRFWTFGNGCFTDLFVIGSFWILIHILILTVLA